MAAPLALVLALTLIQAAASAAPKQDDARQPVTTHVNATEQPCRVFGRVVDVAGEPIEQVALHFV